MYIHAKVKHWVNKGLYCGSCCRMTEEKNGMLLCELYIEQIKYTNDGTGRLVKCDSCLRNLTKEITGGL